MNILFVLEYFPPHIGGVEKFFDNLTKELSARGHSVSIYTTLVPGSKRFEISEGRKIYRQPVLSRHTFPLRGFVPIARLAKHADIIHTTTYSAAGSTALSRLFTRKPTVITVHEIWDRLWFEFENPFSATINWFLETMICKVFKNSFITCPSEYTKQALIKKNIPPENITVIPHGVEHQFYHTGVKPSYNWGFPTYFYMGRPGISKGIEYLLNAVPLITKEVPEAKLVMRMGKSPRSMYNKYLNMIKGLGIENNVILLEPLYDQKTNAATLRSVDCVCVPSLSEGFCFSAVEAQACGVPVVASLAGSLPEVVGGGRFAPPRSAEAIAKEIVSLLKDAPERKALGKAGAEFVKRFTWDYSIKQYIALYEKMIGDKA